MITYSVHPHVFVKALHISRQEPFQPTKYKHTHARFPTTHRVRTVVSPPVWRPPKQGVRSRKDSATPLSLVHAHHERSRIRHCRVLGHHPGLQGMHLSVVTRKHFIRWPTKLVVGAYWDVLHVKTGKSTTYIWRFTSNQETLSSHHHARMRVF